MDEKLLSAFEYAIENADVEMFDFLSRNFDDFAEEEKNAILERTVIGCPDTDFIQHVLDMSPDFINYKDEEGNTLLHFAAASSNPSTVKFFLSKGLDIEAKSTVEGATPLCVAAKESEDVKVLETLIKAGADMHATSRGGETLLITAAGFNTNPEVIEYLLKKGFDPEDRDEEGFTAILNAAHWQPNVEIFDVLLKASANITAKTNKGDNALHLASINPSPAVFLFLSQYFLLSETNKNRETCMEKFLMYCDSEDVMVLALKKLKQEHMMTAAVNRNPLILETLIKSGYDPNAKDSDGISVMMLVAMLNENPDVIKMLRYHGASIKAHDSLSRNVLHYAAANSNTEIYEWMMSEDDFRELSVEKDAKGNEPSYYRENRDAF